MGRLLGREGGKGYVAPPLKLLGGGAAPAPPPFFLRLCNEKLKILKNSFTHREHIQKKERGPYFEVLATQASTVILTTSGDESHRKA